MVDRGHNLIEKLATRVPSAFLLECSLEDLVKLLGVACCGLNKCQLVMKLSLRNQNLTNFLFSNSLCWHRLC
jgi:hypothetical protein